MQDIKKNVLGHESRRICLAGAVLLATALGCSDDEPTSTKDAGSMSDAGLADAGEPNAGPTLTGTVLGPGAVPLPGEIVQLAQLREDEVQLEAVVGAAAITGSDGRYAIPLPASVMPATTLQAVIGSVSAPRMAAIVIRKSDVDVRPASTAVASRCYQLLRNRGERPSEMSLAEATEFIDAAMPVAIAAEQGADVEAATEACGQALEGSAMVSETMDRLRPVNMADLVVDRVEPSRRHVGEGQREVRIFGRNFVSDTRASVVQGCGEVVTRPLLPVCCTATVSDTELTARIGTPRTDLPPGRYPFHVSSGAGCSQIRRLEFEMLPPPGPQRDDHRDQPRVGRTIARGADRLPRGRRQRLQPGLTAARCPGHQDPGLRHAQQPGRDLL